jgi:ABC-2 type transport system ATP-binding protein
MNFIKENIGVVLDESSFPENLNAAEINNILKKIYKTKRTKRTDLKKTDLERK